MLEAFFLREAFLFLREAFLLCGRRSFVRETFLCAGGVLFVPEAFFLWGGGVIFCRRRFFSVTKVHRARVRGLVLRATRVGHVRVRSIIDSAGAVWQQCGAKHFRWTMRTKGLKKDATYHSYVYVRVN